MQKAVESSRTLRPQPIYFVVQQAAELGSADAAFQLGLIHADDDDSMPDYSEAAAWFTRAADAKHSLGRYNLAWLLIEGKGVDKDVERGVALLKEIADEGNAAAAEALFFLYSEGEHVPSDPERAAEHLAQAVEAGSVSSARLLADWHLDGKIGSFG